ncbi:MAG: SAF domain-containing protein [Ethanoligenens sp.]
MKKKNKTMVGVLCIAVAVIISGLFWYANNANLSAVPVVRAKTTIPVGTKITADMLETVDMGRLNLPANITGNTSQVVGAYASTQISAHQIITGTDLLGHQPTYALENGQMLYSVTMKNLADSLSGKLQSGDIVRVVVPQQSNAGNNTSSSAWDSDLRALQYVRVTAVTASNGQDANQTQSTSSTASGSSTNQPATVTLLVSQTQVDALAALGQQEIQLALVSRGDAKRASQLLEQQNAVLQEGVQ